MHCLPFFSAATTAAVGGGANRNAGFKLRMRKCKGPGRLLFRTYLAVSRAKLLLSVDESGATDGETRYSDHLYAMCSDALSGARPPLHFIGVESQFKNS